MTEIKKEVFAEHKHAKVFWIKSHPHVALIETTTNYIPIEQFKEIFDATEKLIVENKITKLIFDKRSLRVFHQPSMVWYFVEWKGKMADLGLINHVKILPDDEVFCHSVRIGRDEIEEKYPDARFHELAINYAVSLEDAVVD